MVTLTVVLDIDEVLVLRRVNTIQQLQFFSDFGTLVTADKKTFCLLPAVRQFLQLLHKTEGIRISFFSSGTSVRNRDFVDSLYLLSLPEKYPQIVEDTKILSRADRVNADVQELVAQFLQFNILSGSRKKDISKALFPGDLLEQAVLIDDKIHNVAIGQVKNYLHLPETTIYTFELLHKKCAQYSSDGFKELPCYMVSYFRAKCTKQTVIQGKAIQVVKDFDHFKIRYLDHESGEFQKRLLCQEKHSLIIEKLSSLSVRLEYAVDEQIQIQDKELIKELMACVSDFGGRGKKLCRSINRIYYAAGLLFSSLEYSKKQNIPITERLFELQFTLVSADVNTYRPDFLRLRKRDELYWYGLRKMQEINPELKFLSPFDYLHYTDKQIPFEQQSDLLDKFFHQEKEKV